MNYPITVTEDYENRWVEMDNETYHADKKAVNSSSLKEMITSPMAYLHAYKNGTDATKAMEMGKRAHLAILEGQKFIDLHVVEPEFTGLTQQGKLTNNLNCTAVKNKRSEWYEQLKPGSVVVTQEELDSLLYMIQSITEHKIAYPILAKGKSEAKGYFRDPVTGLLCRAMIDFLSFELDAMVDIKTTTDPRWHKFRYSVEEYNYGFQMAFYSYAIEQISGKSPTSNVWISIQSKAPYEVRVHEVHPCYMDQGAFEFRTALNKLSKCIGNNRFPQGQILLEECAPSQWYQQVCLAREIHEG